MTIPSRPAPAPPQQQQQQQQQQQTSQQRNFGAIESITIKLPPPPAGNSFQRMSSSKYHKTSLSTGLRAPPAAPYAPIASNWDSPFDEMEIKSTKKVPPPRPPPPQISTTTRNTVLKKPGPPQSVNVLANLFGRKKSKPTIATNLNSLPISMPSNNKNNYHSFATAPSWPSGPTATTFHLSQTATHTTTSGDFELIRFDSPPSSPTFTQKSNSDCVSVDSFSSDSNFSSPQNGSVSQPESGFEDDFTSPSDPWDPFSNLNNGNSNNIHNKNSSATNTRNYCLLNEIRMPQPVRNLNAINRNQNDNPLCNGKSLLPPQDVLTMPTIIKPKTSVFVASSNGSSPVHAQMKNRQPIITSTIATTVFPNDSFDDSPLPMPNGPPPPPPANILSVINGQVDALQLGADSETSNAPSYGIALYDFDGIEDGDLSFRENEKIYLLQRLNNEWYLGRNRRGCEGMFPSNYVDVKVPLKDDDSKAGHSQTSSKTVSSTTAIGYRSNVRVLYNFNAEAPEDLTLKENDLVTVLYRINSDWIYGEINGRQGQFPANFLEYIPENLPQQSGP